MGRRGHPGSCIEELIARARTGGRKAQEARDLLVIRMAPLIREIHERVRALITLREFTQEVRLKFDRSLRQLKSSRAFSSWTKTLLVRLSTDIHRRHHGRTRKQQLPSNATPDQSSTPRSSRKRTHYKDPKALDRETAAPPAPVTLAEIKELIDKTAYDFECTGSCESYESLEAMLRDYNINLTAKEARENFGRWAQDFLEPPRPTAEVE